MIALILLFLESNCPPHLCSAWTKQSMFSAVSWSSAALSSVLQLFLTLSCSGHWLRTVLSPVPLFKSLQMPKWCEPLQFQYLFPNTRWCLGFTYSQTMSCFCGLWYFCHRSHFLYAVSHICQNYPSSLSFSLGRVASFSWKVLVGLFLHLFTISVSLPWHYSILISSWPSHTTMYFQLSINNRIFPSFFSLLFHITVLLYI